MSRHHIVESSPLLADLQHHVAGLIAARLSFAPALIAVGGSGWAIAPVEMVISAPIEQVAAMLSLRLPAADMAALRPPPMPK